MLYGPWQLTLLAGDQGRDMPETFGMHQCLCDEWKAVYTLAIKMFSQNGPPPACGIFWASYLELQFVVHVYK